MNYQNEQDRIPNYYLYGTVVTRYSLASLNHGMRQGNKTLLQKAYWYGKIHSLVNSSAIRWALRFYLQKQGYSVNRIWDEEELINRLIDENFDPNTFYDDDIFGYALLESTEEERGKRERSSSTRRRRNRRQTNTPVERTGALSMNNGVSLIPYDGSLQLGAKSGRHKDSTSLHFTEYHATRYQYYFGIDPTHLKVGSRVLELIDGIMDIPKVGGSSNIFNYPFCPDSFVFQWTSRCAIYLAYCFENENNTTQQVKLKKDLMREVECGEINPDELWIGGSIVDDLQELDNFQQLQISQAHLYRNRTELIANLKAVMIRDLQLEKSRSVIFTIALFLLVEISLPRLGLRLFYQYKKAE